MKNGEERRVTEQSSPFVEMRGITKRFGALVADDGVDLDLYPGEVHALLGENGAGKSTLMKILYGRYQADAGDIRLGGQPVRLASPAAAIAHGIGMVSQHFTLIRTLTVAENVVWVRPPASLSCRRRAAVAATAQRYFHLDPAAWCAICRWASSSGWRLSRPCTATRACHLDEPTAVLTPQEAGRCSRRCAG
jgi:simple sugar transport system ATP-binding protein